jgi:hypothetical protein
MVDLRYPEEIPFGHHKLGEDTLAEVGILEGFAVEGSLVGDIPMEMLVEVENLEGFLAEVENLEAGILVEADSLEELLAEAGSLEEAPVEEMIPAVVPRQESLEGLEIPVEENNPEVHPAGESSPEVHPAGILAVHPAEVGIPVGFLAEAGIPVEVHLVEERMLGEILEEGAESLGVAGSESARSLVPLERNLSCGEPHRCGRLWIRGEGSNHRGSCRR